MKRRDLLKSTTAVGAVLSLNGWKIGLVSADPACEILDCENFILSDPTLQPKFAELVPNALDPAFHYRADKKGRYKVSIQKAFHEAGLINPRNGRRLKTAIFGYGDDSGATWPGKTFEITSSSGETTVRWSNDLKGRHLLPVDTSVHWTYSLPGFEHLSIKKDGVPIITHLHGGHSDFQFDGNPEFFYSPDGEVRGPSWATQGVDFPTPPDFRYDNEVPAGTLWYHDHALGITRLNVYAGMAGFYIKRDSEDDGEGGLGLPSGDRELALAIQDRMFTDRGELFYPAFPGDPAWADFITGEGLADDEVPQPSALAEFFGDHMVVNGKIWPRADVARDSYRLRLLNGCDSRFLVVQFKLADASDPTQVGSGPALAFKVVGSDQGLGSTETMTRLVIEPGGRYDLVFDFTPGFLRGERVIMENIGGDEPFGENPGEQIFECTDRIMAFDVADDGDVGSSFGNTGKSAYVNDEDVALTRKVALFEGTDEYGRLQPLLGTVDDSENGFGSIATPHTWFQETTEKPNLGDADSVTEIWEIYNFTGDAHPIHLHLVHFQILGRDEILFESDEGDPGQPVIQHNGTEGRAPVITDLEIGDEVILGPDDGYYETAPKDMVTCPPEQVTRIKVTFDKTGRYVWHCHILSHEDHEMMRVLYIESDTVEEPEARQQAFA